MKRSLLMPFVPDGADGIETFARIVKEGLAHRLWQGENILRDPYVSFASALSGSRVRLGIGVSLFPLRHPMHAAIVARSLAVSVGSPIVVGFGPGPIEFQKMILGHAYRSPLTATREYLSIVRSLLSGRPVDHGQAEYFRCDRNIVPMLPSPRVSLGLGVLRPGMARLAGEVADVVVTWLAPANYIAEVLVPAIREGADSVGRPMPRISAIVPAAIDSGQGDPRQLVVSGNGIHLRADHYQSMLRLAGVKVADDPMETAASLIESGSFMFGDRGQVSRQIDSYEAAGVDELIFNATGRYNEHGLEASLEDLSTLLATSSSMVQKEKL